MRARVAAGQVNRSPEPAGRSWKAILARNTFTRLNLLFACLGVAAGATGAGPDMTFLVIAVVNTLVGTIQEVRAKRQLDALAVVNAPTAQVRRDGETVKLPAAEVVLGDVLELGAGDQIVADARVVDGGIDVDESLVTGESVTVPKEIGDELLSGSWVLDGAASAAVSAVGAESYAGKLAQEARRYTLTGSQLMAGINAILKWLSVAMIVIAPALAIRQLQTQPWRPAIRSTIGGLVGMIPEGLVLLTTLAFLTAALRLGRRRVLVQELPAVEVLARVDALCTDKTGTLTEGRIRWGGLVLPHFDEAAADGDRPEAAAALAALAHGRARNSTLDAVAEGAGDDPDWDTDESVAFNSVRKWSAADFAGHGTWVLGAPEMVTADDPDGLRAEIEPLVAAGNRVLVLARTDAELDGDDLPAGLTLAAVVYLTERVRGDASDTLDYFAREGVTVRVVSGDAAATVGTVAAKVGLPGAEDPVDARELPTDPAALADEVDSHTVFGRVTPEQKRSMVDALHDRGHVVAMTGDGVNDTLALKDADLGIAMGSGATIARGVSQLVLLDNQFAALPAVVAEGRRVLHNIERAAVLFLVKNLYSIVLSLVAAGSGMPYPFLPRHLTLIASLGSGLPGFFLALAPSEQRFQGGFVRRALTFSAIAGIVTSAAIVVAYEAARAENVSLPEARTAAVVVAILLSLWVIVLVARPLRPWKIALVAAMAAGFAAAFAAPGINTFFGVADVPRTGILLQSIVAGLAGCALVWIIDRLRYRWFPF
ncbi:MAG TPA: HAD-IC family P-type ATPase [Acidimicrobiales bacterium]|nr:HAD-IC family P-type ATPase [Acidimicrobiales bacterium]